jgi:hypothetical protein
MLDSGKIQSASMTIRQVSPEAWEVLAKALREYAAQASVEMIRCAPEFLLKAQGMAVAAQEISTAFVMAPQNYDRQRQKNG